jgi:hypothetical protein
MENNENDGQPIRRERERSRKEKEAFDIVRRASQGRSRDQLSNLLEGEREQRGLPKDPLTIELAIDAIEAGDGGALGQLLGVIRNIGGSHGDAIRGRVLHDFIEQGMSGLAVPAWLEPPVGGRYYRGGGFSSDWVEVVLDAGVRSWLESAYREAPVRTDKIVVLSAWFACLKSCEEVGVHIGAQQVGLLDREATMRWRPAVEAATRREELLLVNARLVHVSRRELPYLLTIPLPR